MKKVVEYAGIRQIPARWGACGRVKRRLEPFVARRYPARLFQDWLVNLTGLATRIDQTVLHVASPVRAMPVNHVFRAYRL